MRRRGFSKTILVLGASLFVLAAIVTYFLSSKHLLLFSKAQNIADLPIAPPGSEVTVEIDPLSPIDVPAVLENPDTSKILMKNVNGELEIDVEEATGEGRQNQRGKTDFVNLVGIEIRPVGSGLQLSSGQTRLMADFPVSFNKLTGLFAVETQAGQKFIRVLPDQALETVKSDLNGGVTKMELVEVAKSNMGDDLAFRISGKTNGAALGVFPLEGIVTIDVGAQSGLVIRTDGPWWMRVR